MSSIGREKLTQRLYEAAAGETPWSIALEALDGYMGSFGTVVLRLTKGQPTISSPSLVETTTDYAREGWDRIDERFRSVPKMRSGGIARDHDLFSEDQMKRMPFYQDFILTHGLKWWSGFAVKAAGQEYCFSLQRSSRQNDFGRNDYERMVATRPLLVSILTLQQARIDARLEGMLDILEALSQPAFVITHHGAVLRWNGHAEALLGKGLKVVNGRLGAEIDEGRRAIEDLDYQLRGRAFSTSLATRPVFVVRPIGRPLILSILSDGPVVADLFASGGAIVVACDPDLRPRGGEEILAAAFHLTRAEASLAAGVATGLSLVDYAEQAGLAEATVRTLMKRVLAKSDTSRQGEFIAMAGRVLSATRKPK